MAKRPRRLSVVPFEKKPTAEVVKPFTDAIDLLKQMIAEIEEGKAAPDKMLLFFLEQAPNGGLFPRYWSLSITASEQIAYGALLQAQALENWKKP